MILAAWFTLNVVDFILTWAALSMGALEANLIMTNCGIDNMALLALWKIVGATVAILILGVIKASAGAFHFANVGMACVCGINIFTIGVIQAWNM